MKKLNLTETLTAKGIALEDAEKKMLDGMSAEINDVLDDASKGAVTADSVGKSIADAIEKLPKELSAKMVKVGEGDAAKSIEDILREQGTELSKLKDQSLNTNAAQNPYAAQAKTVKDLVGELKSAKDQNGTGAYSVSTDKDFNGSKTDKVAVSMTSSNTQANASGVTVPANYMYGVEAQAEPDVRIDPYITQFVDNGTTDLAAMPYADKLPTEGTMAITAEGALKPLLSVSIERRFSTAFKIAGRSKVTEEGLDDIPGLQALINGELKYSHDIAEQNAIYTHVSAFAPAFVAGGLAASTNFPSNWDAIRAAIYAVKIASKGRFLPNAAVINSADAYAMGATKDTLGQYVIPTFVLPDGTKVSGVRIVETQDDTNIPAGTFIVGDWRKIKRRVYKPFNLRMGQGIVGNATAANIVSDFESNLYTIIGESRLHLWHYKNNETAFIKSTFATTKAAIDATV